jgi:hypothetical protein
LCLQNKVKSLYVFGSVLSDKFTDKSDIDLIVDFDVSDPFDYADSYFNLKFALQDLLRRPIDLLENKAIKILISNRVLIVQNRLFMQSDK